jgi:hypothetical protein
MRFAAPILFAVILVGCQGKPFADLTTRADYARHGVSFEHPGNWVLSETEAGVKDGSKLHSMTVRTPSGAFVTIQSFDERMKLEVSAWADRLTKDYEQRFAALPQSLEVGVREAVERQLFGEVRVGQRQSFTVRDGDRSEALHAELFVAEFPGGTATVLVQASSEDFERGKGGFDLVLDSLKWTRPAPDREVPTLEIEAPPGPDGLPDMGAARVVGVSMGGDADPPPKVDDKGAEPPPSPEAP